MAEHENWSDYVGFKMPKHLTGAMDAYIARDTHATRSEFIRAAIREKIIKDMPWLLEFEKEKKKK